MKSTLSPEAIKRLAALARGAGDDEPTVVGPRWALPVEQFGDYLRQRAKIESDPTVRFDLERIATEIESMQHSHAEAIRLLRYVVDTNDDDEAREFLAHVDKATR